MAGIREQLLDILEQEMDRKHFLQYAGIVMLSFIGVSGLLKALMAGQIKTKKSSSGYGSSRFGQ